MPVKYFVLLLILFSVKLVVGQSQADEIERLQKIAKESEERAIRAEALAERYRRDGEQRRYLSIAQGMASRSILVQDGELAAILAVQAYNFNIVYNGYLFDDKIYGGIYNALRRYGRIPNKLNSQEVNSLVSNSKTNSTFSIGNDGKIIRWVSQNNEWKSDELFKIKDIVSIQAVALNKEGNLIAVGSADSKKMQMSYVELINVGGQAKRVEGFASKIDKIIFTPNSKGFYALCNSGQSIMYYDFNVTKEVINSKERIVSIDISSDGTKLVGSGSLGNLVIWKTSNYSSMANKIFSDGGSFSHVAFLPNWNERIVGTRNGELTIIDASNGQTKRILTSRASQVTQIQFSHSGKFMATSSVDGTIRIWNLDNVREWPIEIVKSAGTGFVFSPDDKQILSVVDSSVNIWSLEMDRLANELCGLIKRNLTRDEWGVYVAEDLMREKTCPSLPANNK